VVTTTDETAPVDQATVDRYRQQTLADLAAAMSSVLVHIGDRLGLYAAMGDSRPVTSAALAERTGLAERYVREWLHAMAASGWVTYDPRDRTFTLPPERAVLVADEDAPTFMLGGFDLVGAAWLDVDKVVDAFRTGNGIERHERHPLLFQGSERFFRPGYQRNLVATWLPSLDGVADRLQNGARAADVGCRHGAATLLLGAAYPASTFVGYDYDPRSVATARDRLSGTGLANVSFEVADASEFPGEYDVVFMFDCLHDMVDPVRVAGHVRGALRDGGAFVLVEPNAADAPEENHHAMGRLLYAGSVAICLPDALGDGHGAGLGTQAGPARLTSVLAEAGFGSVRVAARTGVNLVVEARP
jgi:SAM-dependent methyltransferase